MTFGARASAQPRYGLHPTIGAIEPSTPTQILGTSARFNPPDGVWNNGEGFRRFAADGTTPLPAPAPADTGGYLLFDDGRDLVAADIHVQGPWAPRSYTALQVSPPPPAVAMHLLRGFLYPHEYSVTGIDGYAAETAFELMIPDQFDPTKSTIILLAHTGTGSNGSNGPGRYPGEPSQQTHPSVPTAFVDAKNAGLQGSGSVVNRYAELDRLVYFTGKSVASGYNIVAGYIVPPIVAGHGALTIQRYLQFERAVQIILDSTSGPLAPPVDVPTGNRTVIAFGGSNGGNLSMFLAAMFPDRFHGAMSTQFALSMRHTAGYQEFFAQTTALQGFGEATYAHGVGYNLPYSGMCSIVGFTHGYATGTPLALWEAGLLKRPLFVHAADEDTVWNGHEEIPLINDGVYAPRGQSTPRSGSPSVNSASIYWMCIDKACHFDAGKYELPPTLHDNGGMQGAQYDHTMSILAFLDEADESRLAATLTELDRPTEAQVIAALFPSGAPFDPDASHDPRLDPFDHALARPSTEERRSSLPVSQPLDLDEDVAVRTAQRGLGTGLGYGGSLVVDESGAVWVGSADGVVTRLVRNDSSSPSYDPTLPTTALVIDERCRWSAASSAQDGPFSLGYGVTGLAVSAEWLAVGTHRRVYVFDRLGGSGLGQPLYSVDLPWSEQRPSRMKLVDDMFGSGGTAVVYLSHMGELVIRDLTAGLPTCAQVSDPDAWDFEVGTGRRASGLSKPIYIASRFHIVEFDIYAGFGGSPPSHNAHVLAASQLFDRATLSWGENGSGEPVLVALSVTKGVFEFDVSATLRLGAQANWFLPTPPPTLYAADGPTAPRTLRSLGDGVFVALVGGNLFYAPSPSAIEKWDLDPGQASSLAKFPAAHYASALAVGDVGQDGQLDVVLATESGQVAYVPRSMLESGDLTPIIHAVLGAEWEVGAPTVPSPAAYSSGSVCAGWGMTWGPSACGGTGDWVQIVDQCSRRWEIKPGLGSGCPTVGVGQPVFRNMVRDETLVSTSPVTWSPRIAAKPFRDLVRMEAPSLEFFPTSQHRDLTPLALTPGTYVKAYRPFDQFIRLGAGFPVPPDIVAPTGSQTETSPYYPLESAVTTAPHHHRQLFEHGYMPISFGGDRVTLPSGDVEAYFWTGSRAFADQFGLHGDPVGFEPAAMLQCHDAVRGLKYPLLPGTSVPGPQSFWSTTSTGGGLGGGFQLHLRNTISFGTPHASQSLRVGIWEGQSRIVIATAGGGVLVLDPSSPDPSAAGVLLERSPESGGDHGFGGIALCVAKVVDAAGAPPTIYMGTMSGHGRARSAGPWGSDSIPSSVWVYDYAPSPASLTEVNECRFDGSSADRPLLLGLCGLAVGDLFDEAADGCAVELIVTTFGGDFMVFDIDAGGSVGALLHHSIHDGALGANNAILVDSVSNPKSVFVAGSMGLRKFTVATGGV